MQKWKVTFVDDHGETVDEVFECEQCPDNEQAAKLIKARLLPVAAELDLNDLEGRTSDASVKSLKIQNSIQILGISPSETPHRTSATTRPWQLDLQGANLQARSANGSLRSGLVSYMLVPIAVPALFVRA